MVAGSHVVCVCSSPVPVSDFGSPAAERYIKKVFPWISWIAIAQFLAAGAKYFMSLSLAHFVCGTPSPQLARPKDDRQLIALRRVEDATALPSTTPLLAVCLRSVFACFQIARSCKGCMSGFNSSPISSSEA